MKGKRLLGLLFFFLLACGAFADEPREVRLTIGQKARSAQVLEGRDGKKGLLFYVQTRYARLWLDQEACDSLERSAQKYLELFEKRRLKRKKKGAFEKIGKKLPLLLEWGSQKDNLDRFAKAEADLGYVFLANSPYFSILMPNVQNQAQNGGPALFDSGAIQISFTKAQLQSLLDALSR